MTHSVVALASTPLCWMLQLQQGDSGTELMFACVIARNRYSYNALLVEMVNRKGSYLRSYDNML